MCGSSGVYPALPARLADAIGGYVDPTEARRIEKELQKEVQRLLTSFVVAGVTAQEAKGKRGR